MSDEWIKFSDRCPMNAQLVWVATYAAVAATPVTFRRDAYERTRGAEYPYTHWKPCVVPEPPKHPLPALPEGFVFDTRDGSVVIKSTIPRQPTMAVLCDHDGLCLTLSPQSRHLAAQLIAAFDEAEKCQ